MVKVAPPLSTLEGDAGPFTFSRVLVANRGEIALRIVRACQDAGLESIAVYADAEADAPFVRQAEEAVLLDSAKGAAAYLDIAQLVSTAADVGAHAVHPGYGFLAENADFAQAVMDAGLVWIGPPPDVIRALGDKLTAREIAVRAGVPVVPSSTGPITTPQEAVRFGRAHGLPFAIKAAFGGGGRGLRVVRDLDAAGDLFAAAVRESIAAFGRGECFVESYVERARHLEVQVLADRSGHVQTVGTRDCTLQRRYQKLLEEAPAPCLDAQQRSLLEQYAASICREAGYVNAGTVEFLLAPDGRILFLEVNTRLQVEHPVTEETGDIDLVRAQFEIAAGIALDADANRAATGPPHRHAMEFRINAEDPFNGFRPATGLIAVFQPPAGPGVRVDTGVAQGTRVSGQFDSLLAKVIVTGRDRQEAIERARRALDEMRIEGVKTTLPFLRSVLDQPEFVSPGDVLGVHTRWIEDEYAERFLDDAPPTHAEEVVRIPIGGRYLPVAVPGLTDEYRAAMHRSVAAVAQPTEGTVRAPIQGVLVRVHVEDGDEVVVGQQLAVVEAMKMENPLTASIAGRVSGVLAQGRTVVEGEVICRIEPTPHG